MHTLRGVPSNGRGGLWEQLRGMEGADKEWKVGGRVSVDRAGTIILHITEGVR